jgi:uncharacterized protein
MRLDDIDTSDVDSNDQGNTGGGFGMPGGGGMSFGRGRMGCGTLVIVIIAALFFKVDLTSMLGGGDQMGSAPTSQTAQVAGSASCDIDAAHKFSCQALKSTTLTWNAYFAKMGKRYTAPGIEFYSENGNSGCGAAQSAMGPFYCPADEKIYVDTAFYDELANRFQAGGDFAQAYVIAHEVGHHIQKLTGIADQVQQAQARASKVEGNQLQVAMELQADCYAGAWAAQNKDRIEPGDVEEGMRAAHQIGDDVLQKAAQGVVVPESFTHGSAEQRMSWLRRGMQTGDPAQCDTFKG